MLRWVTVPVLLAVAGVASAQDTTESVADVTFEAEQVLFRGTDFTISFPELTNPSDPPAVRLEFKADVAADSEMFMDAKSHLEWPEAMTQSWEGVPGGGEVTFDTQLDLTADVVVDTTIFGFNIQFNYNLWNARDNTWNGLKFFDSLLLPGSPSPSVTSFIDNTTAAPVWQLGEGMYPLSFGSYRVELTYNLFVEPDFSMTITGQKVSTRGRDITAHDGTVVVPAPSTNNGTARYESQWFGTVASRFGLDIDPQLDLALYNTSNGSLIGDTDLVSNYLDGVIQPWQIATDERPYQTKNTPYDHALPAIDVDPARLDFGDVLIGNEAQLNIVVEDLGTIDLVGEIEVDGDGFSVSRPDVDVAGEDDLTVVVTFSPEEAGDFEGEIVFTTNDPTHPTVTVALEGVGVDEEDTDPDTDPDDTGDEDGRRGCGCAVDSSAPVGALGMLPIALLIARRRRR